MPRKMKQRALEVIQALPDSATLTDVIQAVLELEKPTEEDLVEWRKTIQKYALMYEKIYSKRDNPLI